MAKDYDSQSIEVLSGLDPVRKRPGMYTDTASPNHLIQEVVDNSIDEALAGHCSTIKVILAKDGIISVIDDGRGMPTDKHPEHKVSGVELIMCKLHAGAKFSGEDYNFSGGLHGVGVSVVNALSENLEVRVKRDSKEHQIIFSNGDKVSELKEIGEVGLRNTGTSITFKPNPDYFENIEIQVFLDKGLSQQQLGDLRKNLAERPFVLHTEDSVYLRFISNKEAAETFIQNTGEDFTQFLEDNPLRDSYVFSVSEEFQSSEQLTLIAKELETQPGVFEVSYMTDLVDSINKNLFKVSLIMGGFILILIVTVIMLINNTIRLALFSQRFLIRSMQLVGATRGFIRKPFLIRAFLFGVLAGILASGILYALLEYTKGNIEGFASLQNTELMLLLFVGLTVTGGFLSGISTLRSVNKYLNMSLDELY